MVGCINGCEGVNIVTLSIVHLSKFGCFLFLTFVAMAEIAELVEEFGCFFIGGWCGVFSVVPLMLRAIAGCP